MDLKKTKTSFKLSNRQELLHDKLKLFYTSSIMDILLPIINGETKLSLRIIDWFVTNYTKKNNIILYNKKKKLITKKSPKSKIESKTKKSKYDYVDEQFNIFLNYKSQLKAYSKKNFDPFCRRERIKFFYNNDSHIVTTIGQLNFFKWCIDNNVINYIETHLEKINWLINKIKQREIESWSKCSKINKLNKPAKKLNKPKSNKSDKPVTKEKLNTEEKEQNNSFSTVKHTI